LLFEVIPSNLYENALNPEHFKAYQNRVKTWHENVKKFQGGENLQAHFIHEHISGKTNNPFLKKVLSNIEKK
jgi:hypothetical protein